MSTAYLWDKLSPEDKEYLSRLAKIVGDRPFPRILQDGALARLEALEQTPVGKERAVIDAATMLVRVGNRMQERGFELVLSGHRDGVEVIDVDGSKVLNQTLVTLVDAVHEMG